MAYEYAEKKDYSLEIMFWNVFHKRIDAELRIPRKENVRHLILESRSKHWSILLESAEIDNVTNI